DPAAAAPAADITADAGVVPGPISTTGDVPTADEQITQNLLNQQLIDLSRGPDITSDYDGDGTPDYYDGDKYADQYHDQDGDGRADGYDQDKYADQIHDRDLDTRPDGYDADKYA